MQHFETIAEYYKKFGHTPPKVTYFDVRFFEQYYNEINSQTVIFEMKPFRVEFYGIGLVVHGTADKHLGKPFDANIIFYSPYQILSFEGVDKNWKGYYLFFDQNFLSQCSFAATFLADFPFLRLENTHPVKLSDDHVNTLLPIFKTIYDEFNSSKKDKFILIQINLNLLLHYIKRAVANLDVTGINYRRKAEIILIAQYKSLIERTISDNRKLTSDYFSPAYYASELHIHQNHLNAVSKRVTNKTAKQLIHNTIIHFAQSFLVQSELSVKEIAYQLGFEDPAHFNNLFKKVTSFTPAQYRQLNS